MSNRSKDAKNGFSGKFYIDIVIRKNSQLFFFDRKKNIFRKWKIFFENGEKKIFFLVREIFSLTKKFSINTFSKNIFHFQKKNFFSIEKKKLRFFSIHYIDVKFSRESIFRIIGVIWQVLHSLRSI